MPLENDAETLVVVFPEIHYKSVITHFYKFSSYPRKISLGWPTETFDAP